jgi:hypothetical protein
MPLDIFKRKIDPNDLEKLKKIVETFVEKNMDPWRKALFYSDPEVKRILRKLYEKWENASYEKRPLDYASEDELRFLARKALAAGLGDVSEFQREVSRSLFGGKEKKR